MSLDTLDNKISSFRADAAKLIEAFREYEASVKSDPTLTLEGKYQKLDGRKDQLKQAVAALEEHEKTAVASEIQSLERSIGGTAGIGGADIISFRDAQDRASRASDAREALIGIRTAITTDDKELARAYVMRAVTERDQNPVTLALGDEGTDEWSSVVQTYIDAYPATAQAVSDLFQLRRRERSAQFGFHAAGAYYVA